jgi:hypothetical protein
MSPQIGNVAKMGAQRRAEDMAIATDIIVRHVAPIDDLVRALEGARGSVRLVRALKNELAARRCRK